MNNLEKDLLAVFNSLCGDGPVIGYIALGEKEVYEVDPGRFLTPRSLRKCADVDCSLPYYTVMRESCQPENIRTYACIGAKNAPAHIIGKTVAFR